MKAFIPIFLYLLISSATFAADKACTHRHFTCFMTGDGLSDNNVKAIAQDDDGFIWFGTKRGLDRYDGSMFTTKECRDHVSGFSASDISALFADHDHHKIWIGTEKGVFVYDTRTDEFNYLGIAAQNGARMKNWVLTVCGDNGGNVWIVIPEQGVFRYKDDRLHFYDVRNASSDRHLMPSHLFVDTQGRVWLSTWGSGILQYDSSSDTFRCPLSETASAKLKGKKISMLCESGQQIIMAVQEGELLALSPADLSVGKLDIPDISQTMIRNIYSFGEQLWIGTFNGIYLYDCIARTTTHIYGEKFVRTSLSDNVIYSMYCDNSGGMWVGTFSGGVCYMPPSGICVENISFSSDTGIGSSVRIREMVCDNRGRIWVGTENKGLGFIAPESNYITEFPLPEGNHRNVLSLALCGNDTLLCGMFQYGIYVVHTRNNTITHYTSRQLGIGDGCIYSILYDSKGRLWIGTDVGLFEADKRSMTCRPIENMRQKWVYDMTEDHEGRIWMATVGDGVWRYAGNGTWKNLRHDAAHTHSLSNNTVSCVVCSDSGRIIVGTDGGGLCIYRSKTDDFECISSCNFFPDNIIYSVIDDCNGNIWAGTGKGLVCFREKDYSCTLYTQTDGLPANGFNRKAMLKLPDGRFLLGCMDGLVTFSPYGRAHGMPKSRIYITDIKTGNRDAVVGCSGISFRGAVRHTEKIVLKNDFPGISLHFAIPEHPSAAVYNCFFRMRPMETEWKRVGARWVVDYPNLPHGNYILEIKATYGNHDVAIKRLHVTVLPAWWQTNAALILYAFAALLIAFIAVKLYKRRKQKKLKLMQLMHDADRRKKKEEAKADMFEALTQGIRIRQDCWSSAPNNQFVTDNTDDEFRQKVIAVICANVTDENFNVERMAELMLMSRSTLLRRMKSTFEESPADIIRMMRLRKAAELIKSGNYRIGEICFMVGFSSSSYFSKLFYRQFGMSPTEYEKYCKNTRPPASTR